MEAISLDNFPAYRDLAREIGGHVQLRIGDYLGLLQPQFRPGSVLGQYVGGKDSPKSAALAYAQFKALFKDVAASASLTPDLPETIEVTCGKPVLTTMTYEHTLAGPGGGKKVTVIAPLKFVITWPEFPYTELRDLVKTRTPKDKLQASALHFALLNFIFMGNKVLLRMFEDLGFPIRSERLEELGGIPLTTMSCPAGSVRPSDTVIAQICRFTGTNVIEEVADVDGWTGLNGALGQFAREQAEKLLTGM